MRHVEADGVAKAERTDSGESMRSRDWGSLCIGGGLYARSMGAGRSQINHTHTHPWLAALTSGSDRLFRSTSRSSSLLRPNRILFAANAARSRTGPCERASSGTRDSSRPFRNSAPSIRGSGLRTRFRPRRSVSVKPRTAESHVPPIHGNRLSVRSSDDSDRLRKKYFFLEIHIRVHTFFFTS